MLEDITEAFLLCGGESERLGFPKEMLRVEGEPLAARLVDRLRRVFADVAVVTNRPSYLAHWMDVPIYEDRYPGRGPMAGIHSALCETRGEAAFFLACDMPLVTVPMMQKLVKEARRSGAAATAFRTEGGVEPMCGMYRRDLMAEMERRLKTDANLSPWNLAREVGACFVPADEEEARRLRDLDLPGDIRLLREAFREVEPLPVRRRSVTRFGGSKEREDLLVLERAVALHVNRSHLVTLDCLPGSLRELAVGLCVGSGLAEAPDQIESVEADYRQNRIDVVLNGGPADPARTLRRHLASGCGAQLGAELGGLRGVENRRPGFRVDANHILRVLAELRGMAPVFGRTGATHQAAFSDGQGVRYFAEDVGRHNAVDKVVGGCLLRGVDLSRGVLVVTGRLNTQIVTKILRCGVPVLASRSASTARAARRAGRHGLTLIGFARGKRMNIYTHPERVNLEGWHPQQA